MDTVSEYTVTGMTCQHCVTAVTEEVSAIEGVTEVQIDLPTGLVSITSEKPVEGSAVRAAIDEAGYEVSG